MDPSAIWCYSEKMAASGLPASITMTHKFLLLITYLVYGIFIIACPMDEDTGSEHGFMVLITAFQVTPTK